MNAEAPMLDAAECARFLHFWAETAGLDHVTLVGIIPDGDTTARTFAPHDDKLAGWIAARQEAGQNVYFQPNETRADCGKKPAKTDIVSVVCRFADIDPDDERFPFAEERERLTRLSDSLAAHREFAPTAIIDSGNGLQALWAIQREATTPEVVRRVEAETKSLEAALGAGGTHNVDRLLRLPGTINFPNRKKLSLGRGVARARLIHAAPNLYQVAEAADLAERWANNPHVRVKPAKATKAGAGASGDDVGELVEDLLAAGADRITQAEGLPFDLGLKLAIAIKARKRLADRWAGMIDDLTAAGKDDSRSGADFSLSAMLKAAGFSHLETGLILCAFPHGKVNGDTWPNDNMRLRQAARAVLHSYEPKNDRQSKSSDDAIDAVNRTLAEFNAKFMVVNEAGRAVIYAPAEDLILHRRYYDRLGLNDLRSLYLNRRIQVGEDEKGNPIMRGVAEVWLRHSERRQFINGVTFDPSGKPTLEGTLNLWQGFAVTPKQGSWEKLRNHIREVLCAGSDESYRYVINWMARLVQRPAEQGEVAIVMRGAEGTGKGTLARALKRILGQHALAISNAKHLTGNFNAHLRDCVFLFADEAFFAGDRQHVGVLKAIITEPYLTVEGKYQNAVQSANFLHLMMASNEEWVVLASLEARRFLVLEATNAHKDDHEYFAAIWTEMEVFGGYEAMLHDLLHTDLTAFNVRRVPSTDGLQQQKKLSLDTDKSWWRDVLHRGYVFRSRLGLDEYFHQWHEEIATELLYASYTEFAEKARERRPMSREAFGRFMSSMSASQSRPRNKPIGEHITDVASPIGTTRKAALINHPRPPSYQLHPLRTARDAFERNTGLSIEWPPEPEDED